MLKSRPHLFLHQTDFLTGTRVYALYEQDRKVGIFLLTILGGFLGVMIAVPILAFDYIRLPSWPGPCLGEFFLGILPKNGH
jgi:hypothetical protein